MDNHEHTSLNHAGTPARRPRKGVANRAWLEKSADAEATKARGQTVLDVHGQTVMSNPSLRGAKPSQERRVVEALPSLCNGCRRVTPMNHPEWPASNEEDKQTEGDLPTSHLISSATSGSPKQGEAAPEQATAEPCKATEPPYYPTCPRNGGSSLETIQDRQREEGTRKGTESPEPGGKGGSHSQSETSRVEEDMRMMSDRLEKRLSGISIASEKGQRGRDLYRTLYDKELWMRAYANIYANDGATTKGTDEVTLDGTSEERIDALIESLRHGTYEPKPVRRTYIPKANGKERPLGVPSGDDKLLQEVARILLERIYEPVFSDHSHGFRKGRSCHTALKNVVYWSGATWLIDVDVKGFFDSLDHDLLLDLLRKRIDDNRFVKLIRMLLKAGYMEDWKYSKTYSGTPQGGVISPILANIYLHELDTFMEKIMGEVNTVEKRELNPEYNRIRSQINSRRKRIKRLRAENADSELVTKIKTEVEKLQERQWKIPSGNPDDPNFRRVRYERYGDDFLIGMIAPKKEAEALLDRIVSFIRDELKLEVNTEKTRIRHVGEGCLFLGYEVRTSRARSDRIRRVVRSDGTTQVKRTMSRQINLYVPDHIPAEFCREHEYGDYGKILPKHRAKFIRLSDLEIVHTYNAELRGLANYYALAKDVKRKLHRLVFLGTYSLFKTLANKHKTSKRTFLTSMKKGNEYAYRHEVNGKERSVRVFKLAHLDPRASKDNVDIKPNAYIYEARGEILERMQANRCEYCGTEEPCEIHHVRKVSNLKGRERWEKLMIARRRKTLVLCKQCHTDLHRGTLPDKRYTEAL